MSSPPDGLWFGADYNPEQWVVPARGVELLSGRVAGGRLEVAPGGVAVVREDAPPGTG